MTNLMEMCDYITNSTMNGFVKVKIYSMTVCNYGGLVMTNLQWKEW